MARQSVNDFEPWPPWLSENTMVTESGHKISVLRWRFVMQSTFLIFIMMDSSCHFYLDNVWTCRWERIPLL